MPIDASGLDLLNAGALSIIPDDFDPNRHEAMKYSRSNGIYQWCFLVKDPGTTVFDAVFSLDG